MKEVKYSKTYLVLAIVLILFCSRFPDYDIDELMTAPQQVEIDNREFVLDTEMWRDFQPVCPPDGTPMIAIAWVIATDSLPFPPSLDFDYLWVVKNENDVWTTGFEEDETAIDDFKLKKVARNGPKWEVRPDPLYVDAIVRVKDAAGNYYLLRAADQIIYATY